jgi:peptide/nickel transport system substrate-binding protein
MSGRRRILVQFLLAVLLAAGGCATGDGNGGGGGNALVVAAAADESVLEPPFAANVATGYNNANAPVFETLVELTPDYTVAPLLATSWEFRPPNTWRFQLRPGVTFHDGQPFDAKAVEYNATEFWAELGILALGPESVAVVDDLTIDLTPTVPNRRLVEQLVHPLLGLKAPGTYAGPGATSENRPTGTGPFKFSSYRNDVQLDVERNDAYWGPRPKVDRITFRFLPDAQARALALKAGDVDAAYDFRPDAPGDAGGTSGITVATSGIGAYDALLLSHRGSSPLRELAVRQAVASAVDRATIVDTVWDDAAEIIPSLVPPAMLGAGAGSVRGWAYDPALARRLLDESGWTSQGGGVRSKDGRSLDLVLRVYDADAHSRVPELIQRQLGEVGVGVRIDLDTTGYGESMAMGDGDLFLEIGNLYDANPLFPGALFTAAPTGFADYATSFGAGPQYDDVFTRGIGSPDIEEVRRLAGEAMHVVVDEVVAVVPVAGLKRVWGLRSDVRGFRPHPSDLSQTWEEVFVQR